MSVGSKRAPRFRVGDSVMFLYGPQHVAGEIVEDRGLLGRPGQRFYQVIMNRGEEDETTVELPEEGMDVLDRHAIQQETPGLRQEFDITYTRPKNSNEWTATTKRGKLFKGIRAKGAVGYTTAMREGETWGDENQGIVTVFLECDQTMCDGRSRVFPSAWQGMTETARRLADQMFKRRHPDAVIEHDDDED